MLLKTASQYVSIPSLHVKRGALAILFLPAVATALSGCVATGNYANDLGHIVGAIDWVKHRTTVCTGESLELNEPLASVLVKWNERNLFVIGEVNDRYQALIKSLPKSQAEEMDQLSREQLDQMKARYSSMSPAQAKAFCQRFVDILNDDLSNLENALRSRLESMRGYTRSGEK